MFLPSFLRRKSPDQGLTQQLSEAGLLLILVEQSYKKGQEKFGSKINSVGPLPTSQTPRQTLLQYLKSIYDLLLSNLGPDIARQLFESELNSLKKIYGVNENYFQLLRILPIPVMESERLAILSREELENELKARIGELENIKSGLEKTVLERTKIISAERNKLLVILSSISDAVVAVDLNRRVVICNKEMERIIGLPSSAFIGRPLEQFIQLYDQAEEITIEDYCPIRTDSFEGVIFQKNDLRFIIRPQLGFTNSKQSYVNLTSSKIKEGPQVNLGCILTIHDVTEERHLEQMKLDFVSIAAHELRTPLTSLKGYLYIYIRDYYKFLDEKQKTIMTRLNISTQRLVSLAENLLNVSKIERGTLSMSQTEIDWVSNVRNMTYEITDQAKDKKIELKFDPPPQPLPKVYVDQLRINEVLSNLLSNAISYTSPGGKIRVWIEKTGNEIVTHVADTGQGIPKDAIPHLFSKFFRVTGKLEAGSAGTGLGLYIARSIINLHHGRIWVESEFGKGSTFSFALPVRNGH